MKQYQVIAETDRIALCAPDVSHVDGLVALWGDAETMKYIGGGGVWSRGQIEERIDRAIKTQRDRGMTFWTVVEKGSGAMIGQGGLVPIEFNGAEIELGYRLGKEFWGKGYATEIAKMSAGYGFDVLGLDELVAVTYPENLASRRVLVKAGFIEDGESNLYYGVPAVVYRMIKGEEKS